MVIPLDSVQVPYDPPTEYPDGEQDKPIDGLALVPREFMTSIMPNHLISWFNLSSLLSCVYLNYYEQRNKEQDRGLGDSRAGVWRGKLFFPV